MSDEFPIITYAKSIGKNTANMNVGDMLRFMDWVKNQDVKGGEVSRSSFKLVKSNFLIRKGGEI